MSKYSYEEKLEAVLRVIEEGMSYEASAKVLGTAQSQVQRWISRYEKYGSEGLLLHNGTYTEEVQRLRMENEYLKKLNALVQERIKRESGKK